MTNSITWGRSQSEKLADSFVAADIGDTAQPCGRTKGQNRTKGRREKQYQTMGIHDLLHHPEHE